MANTHASTILLIYTKSLTYDFSIIEGVAICNLGIFQVIFADWGSKQFESVNRNSINSIACRDSLNGIANIFTFIVG